MRCAKENAAHPMDLRHMQTAILSTFPESCNFELRSEQPDSFAADPEKSLFPATLLVGKLMRC